MLHDPAEAEDAAQTVFLNALRSLSGFRGTSSLKTWIYRIAANECSARLHMRKRYPTPPTTQNEADDPVATLSDGRRSALDELDVAEQGSRTRRAVLTLPEPYRLPIVLRYFDDLSYEETATVLGVSVDVVKVRLFRAKAMLKTKLAGEIEAGNT
jgi:RNA polymerase sigma-70 factor (ECF subfamily)